MRLLHGVAFVLICLAAAFLARSCSRGAALDAAVREYLSAVASSEGEDAVGFLTDSLSSLVSPDFILGVADAPSSGRLVVGSGERRGLAVSLAFEGGGSRTFWLRSCDGEWRISGDSSLDNLLGAASMTCLSYARAITVPAVSAGEDPASFACPVTGDPYFVRDGALFCPAGHLDPGLDIDGSSCSAVREGLAAEIAAYIGEGNPVPSSFTEMYQRSGGAFGRRSGYRCPDDGYSYYEITPDGVYCPYHEATTVLPVTEDSDAGEGAAA